MEIGEKWRLNHDFILRSTIRIYLDHRPVFLLWIETTAKTTVQKQNPVFTCFNGISWHKNKPGSLFTDNMSVPQWMDTPLSTNLKD